MRVQTHELFFKVISYKGKRKKEKEQGLGFANGDGGDGEERIGKKVPEGERGRGFFALQFQCHTAPFLLRGSQDLLQIGGHRSCRLRRQKLPEGRSFQG